MENRINEVNILTSDFQLQRSDENMINRTRHTLRNFLFCALALIMCIGLPISAFAAEDEQSETTTISISSEQEFRDAVDDINNTEGNYIFSLEYDITLTGGFGNSVILKNSNSVVTILGNGHSIICNFTGQAGIIVNPGATLNLGLPDGSDSLTIKGGDQSLNHTLAMISISVGTVNMYPGVSLRDYTNKATENTSGGGAVSVAFSGGTFNMFGGEISNCSISNTGRYNHGAGVLVRSDAVFNMYGGSISGNTQNSYGYGGGVAVTDATFNMYGGEICNNSAPKYSSTYLGGSGGGVIISDAHFNMTGGKIYGNTAAYTGGGVYVTGDSTFIMSGEEGNEIEIYENTAIYGGGMYMQGSTDAKMMNVKVYKNKAVTTSYYGNGGGLYVRCPLDMTNVEVYENSSAYDCGGVYVFTNTVLNMSNVEIHDNTAASYGGGVLLRAGAEFNASDNVKVYGNTAGYGGGVFSYGSFTFNDGKIYKNTAVLGGGAFVAQTFNMTGGEIYENTVDGAGGGVFINDGGAFNMTGGKIYKNEAKDLGGGVYTCGSLTKTGGVIYNNTAGNAGDDIVAESSENFILDSVGEGLTLESTGQSITDWYHDGSRFTGELDGEGNSIYDETRWAAMDKKVTHICIHMRNRAQMFLLL